MLNLKLYKIEINRKGVRDAGGQTARERERKTEKMLIYGDRKRSLVHVIKGTKAHANTNIKMGKR